jgi:hypothetical protein
MKIGLKTPKSELLKMVDSLTKTVEDLQVERDALATQVLELQEQITTNVCSVRRPR